MPFAPLLLQARSNIKSLRDRLSLVASFDSADGPSSSSSSAAPGAAPTCPSPSCLALASTVLGDPLKALSSVDLNLSNVRDDSVGLQGI